MVGSEISYKEVRMRESSKSIVIGDSGIEKNGKENGNK